MGLLFSDSPPKNESRSQFLSNSDKFDFKGFTMILRRLTNFYDFLNDPTDPMILRDVTTAVAGDLPCYKRHQTISPTLTQ